MITFHGQQRVDACTEIMTGFSNDQNDDSSIGDLPNMPITAPMKETKKQASRSADGGGIAEQEQEKITSSPMSIGKSEITSTEMKTFPSKLFAILEDEERYSHIVCWMGDGMAWKLIDPEKLEKDVIPNFFDMTKFNSFVRQVNGWGFQRMNGGMGRNIYFHEMFRRDKPELIKDMRRCKKQSTRQKKTMNDTREAERDMSHTTHISAMPQVRMFTESARLRPVVTTNPVFSNTLPTDALPNRFRSRIQRHPGIEQTNPALSASLDDRNIGGLRSYLNKARQQQNLLNLSQLLSSNTHTRSIGYDQQLHSLFSAGTEAPAIHPMSSLGMNLQYQARATRPVLLLNHNGQLVQLQPDPYTRVRSILGNNVQLRY